MSRYNYKRRLSSVAKVGTTEIGGDNPIRLQSMTNTVTTDTMACVMQTIKIFDAGGEIVRMTTQGEREALNMALIKSGLKERGYDVPLVADVHFNPKAAYVASGTCDKVRINPGNFVDAARTFRKLDFTQEEYNQEIQKIRKGLLPLIETCRKRNVCLRLGVNHGSLSDRIMSRYGDSPAGMVESVMEYLRILEEEDFHNVVISVKASNVVVMVNTVKLLSETMASEGMNYPLHLGVTEAGDGEDGRIKSAVGIGALLAEGFGDTIRVSLSEEPEKEIPVAKLLRDYISLRADHHPVREPREFIGQKFAEEVKKVETRGKSTPVVGFENVPYPIVEGEDFSESDTTTWHQIDASSRPSKFSDLNPVVIRSEHKNRIGEIAAWIDVFVAQGGKNPIIICLDYDVENEEELQVKAGADFGSLILNGYGRGFALRLREKSKGKLSPHVASRTMLGILQATRLRFSKTEYIACPGCGRTLFDLPATLAEVKKATQGIPGLKIGVMGCVVNGPGEMADADYGYVGAGRGRVSIYKGKEVVKKNLPADEAIKDLLNLIKQDRKG